MGKIFSIISVWLFKFLLSCNVSYQHLISTSAPYPTSLTPVLLTPPFS